MKRRAIPKSERHIIYRKCDGHCAYCGKKIEFKEMQVDHYFPVVLHKRYSHLNIDDTSNLMPSCRQCNHYKRGDSPDAFREKMFTIHKRVAGIYILKVCINYGICTITPFDGAFYFENNRQFGIIYPDDITTAQ